MSKSAFIKLSLLVVAALAAKRGYSAFSSRNAARQQVPDAKTQGESADAFSTDAIQHDLSVGDAV
ncbi:MAG: hypothetical protein JWN23_1829 [Rhodocyclales bacterium]|nr:hypothetical protein [Rhodocyclales bacterium]